MVCKSGVQVSSVTLLLLGGRGLQQEAGLRPEKFLFILEVYLKLRVRVRATPPLARVRVRG